jgi:hypothetical protein
VETGDLADVGGELVDVAAGGFDAREEVLVRHYLRGCGCGSGARRLLRVGGCLAVVRGLLGDGWLIEMLRRL